MKTVMPRRRRSRGRQITPIGHLEQRCNGWWIVMPGLEDHGPYPKESEADEDWLGLTHFCLDHKEWLNAAAK